MTTSITEALVQSLNTAKQHFIRIPIFIIGDADFVLPLLKTVDSLTLVSDEEVSSPIIKWKETKKWLGNELDSLCFDLRSFLDVDKICSLSGCIKGGSIVVFWLRDFANTKQNFFEQRLNRLIASSDFLCISQHAPMRFTPLDINYPFVKQNLPTKDQLESIGIIKKVLTGHRKRPALLIADRGRGKSAALGIAAAQIMQEQKKNILVCSPNIKNVETLFKHAKQNLSNFMFEKNRLSLANNSNLSFIAPDVLLNEKPKCDLLIIDEAAAIPIPMLNQFMTNYSRIVFSSTEHGYEGTGRGFSTLFKKQLDLHTKGWKEIKLKNPIRYAQHCPLEKWLYDVFLFDAEPDEINPEPNKVILRNITQQELVNNESLLTQIFALLITAHYQTSPNDLLYLLNAQNLILIGAFANEQLVGILLAQQEGGFEEKLADQIVLGKRRVKGHLLPQSLAQHTGLKEALIQPLLRIVRLAVLPNFRRMNLATDLINNLELIAKQNNIHTLGSSFSASFDLISFWLKQDFIPVRLGIQKDAASGNHSLQLIKNLSTKPLWCEQLKQIFAINFQSQVSNVFRFLEPTIAARLLSLTLNQFSLNDLSLTQVKQFANNQLGSDLIIGSLQQFLLYWLCLKARKTKNQNLLTTTNDKLAFCRIIQNHDNSKLVADFSLSGKNEIENNLRQWFKAKLHEIGY